METQGFGQLVRYMICRPTTECRSAKVYISYSSVVFRRYHCRVSSQNTEAGGPPMFGCPAPERDGCSCDPTLYRLIAALCAWWSTTIRGLSFVVQFHAQSCKHLRGKCRTRSIERGANGMHSSPNKDVSKGKDLSQNDGALCTNPLCISK